MMTCKPSSFKPTSRRALFATLQRKETDYVRCISTLQAGKILSLRWYMQYSMQSYFIQAFARHRA